MTALWKQWAAKLDELSLRERGFVFVVAAALVVVLVHAAALQPLLREQRAYLERIKLDQEQLKAIGDELAKSAPANATDPQAAKSERIRKLEGQVAASEKRVVQRRDAEQLSPQQLPRLLQDVLGENRGLRVIALRVLPAAALPQPAAPAVLPGQPAVPRAPAVQFYRHSVEVEMTGTYLELLKYLEDVEALPWRLAWTNVELKTTSYPQVHLRAAVSTVSSSPTLITF
jgi:MSHA biogenesis protein MshJ